MVRLLDIKPTYHFEFTHHRGTVVGRSSTQDNLLVFYILDNEVWLHNCNQMVEAGFMFVLSYNPNCDQSNPEKPLSFQ